MGIAASYDIVALENATLNLINNQKYIDGSLPGHLKFEKDRGHFFERIWGKNPYIQVREAAKLGLGKPGYRIKEIT